MLDEREFLSPYGIRSLSRYHAEHPYVFVTGTGVSVSYLPADSDSACSGATPTGAGPIWMPVNALIVRALLQYYAYYGDAFTVECPTGSGRQMTLYQVAEEISRRLAGIFLRGRGRPAAGLRRDQQVPGGPELAGSHPVPRVLPRRQRGRRRSEPPDRMDRRRRAGHAPVRDHDARADARARQEGGDGRSGEGPASGHVGCGAWEGGRPVPVHHVRPPVPAKDVLSWGSL